MSQHPHANRRFRLVDPKTNADVLGGAISIENPYVLGYSRAVRDTDKGPRDLEVGESVLRSYSLCGSHGTYLLVRLEDAVPVESTPTEEA